MTAALREAAVAVCEPQPRLRAHLERVVEAAGYRVVALEDAAAAIVAADGPGAMPMPKTIPVVGLWLQAEQADAVATPPERHIRLQRPFTPDALLRRLDDALAGSFRGATAPMAPSDADALREASLQAAQQVTPLAEAIAAEAPAWAALDAAERAQAVQSFLDEQADA